MQFPHTTRFHPTFLYESLWSVGALITLLRIERRAHHWLLPGDLILAYGILYSLGRFWIEGLRVDILCIGGIGDECVGGQFRTTQLLSLLTITLQSMIMCYRHIRQKQPATLGEAPAQSHHG